MKGMSVGIPEGTGAIHFQAFPGVLKKFRAAQKRLRVAVAL